MKSGCLITGLEPEIALPYPDLSFLVIFHSLFARRIVLSDSHGLDNANFRRFFAENYDLLEDERYDGTASPIFSIAGKKGPKLWNAVDLWLGPKGDRGTPTYLTSLSPRQNNDLARDYGGLTRVGQRREKFIEVAGPTYKKHVERLTAYLNRHEDCVVHRSAGTTFFEYVTKQLAGLETAPLLPTDRSILDAIRRIADDRPKGYQSRERLHEAIYEDRPPPRIWKGKPHPTTDQIPEGHKRHEWRMFIDALHNMHHAALASSHAILSPHFSIPKALAQVSLPVARQQTSTNIRVRLGTKLYAEHLDLKFAIALRRQDAFWQSIFNLETHPGCSDVLADHLEIVSEEFAKYLKDEKKVPHLVRRSKAEIVTENVDVYVSVGGLAIMAFGLVSVLEKGQIAFGMGALLSVRESARAVIKKLFGHQEIINPNFKSFITEVENRAAETWK